MMPCTSLRDRNSDRCKYFRVNLTLHLMLACCTQWPVWKTDFTLIQRQPSGKSRSAISRVPIEPKSCLRRLLWRDRNCLPVQTSHEGSQHRFALWAVFSSSARRASNSAIFASFANTARPVGARSSVRSRLSRNTIAEGSKLTNFFKQNYFHLFILIYRWLLTRGPENPQMRQ